MERIITWDQIKVIADRLIETKALKKNTKVWGVPRGGQYLMPFFDPVNTPEEAEVILDDLIDSGSTQKQYKKKFPNKKFIAFFRKHEDDTRWYIFPWEQKKEPLEDNLIRISQFYGLKEVNSLEQLIIEYENR